MTSRERVLAALSLKKPDKVPFVDQVMEGMKAQIMGSSDYDELEFTKKSGLDAILCPDFVPPLYCKTKKDSTGQEIVIDGLIKTRDDLKMVKMPSVKDFVDRAKRFVDQYGNTGYALWYKTRFGAAGVLNSMGIDGFAFAMMDEPDVVDELMKIYSDWCMELVESTQGIGFDFLMFCDDISHKNSTFMSPNIFREVFLPHIKKVVNIIKIPWIFHSDGNIMPVLDDLLTLEMDGLNPIEPGPMDINMMKKEYGKRVCLHGNIDLHYTLTRGTPEEVDAEVKDRIENIGKDGGFIIASANTVTNYCKLENVLAMRDAIEKYGVYR